MQKPLRTTTAPASENSFKWTSIPKARFTQPQFQITYLRSHASATRQELSVTSIFSIRSLVARRIPYCASTNYNQFKNITSWISLNVTKCLTLMTLRNFRQWSSACATCSLLRQRWERCWTAWWQFSISEMSDLQREKTTSDQLSKVNSVWLTALNCLELIWASW